MRYLLSLLTIFCSLILNAVKSCVHDQMVANATYHYYNDKISYPKLRENRLLQTLTGTDLTTLSGQKKDKIRIYADYKQLVVGDLASKNVIKRVVNISANFFYNTLKVDRLDRLYFPSGVPLQCNVLSVPIQYTQAGVIGDLGIMVGNQDNSETYVARSISCALLKSNNRPIWGVIIFNNRNLGYGQIQFQKTVSVGIHEMTHILGFSSALYNLYPAGNPFIVVNDVQYLKSDKIINEIKMQFNCSNPIGLPLQDQDGTINSSHQERKVLGNQFMIAINKKQAYFSRLTFALLDSTGWYEVNYTYAEPSGWGKNKSCDFLNIDICDSEQFCKTPASQTNIQLSCDWDGTAYGSCINDPFAGTCNIVNYYTNTICIDQVYNTSMMTKDMQAKQLGGSTSRCYYSNFKNSTVATNNPINYRCYNTICSSTGYLFVKIEAYVLSCRYTNQILYAPIGMVGTLICPNFKNYCLQNKKTCPYHCNKNGVCINGMCLCTGATILTSACTDDVNTTIQSTAGLLNSKIVIDHGEYLDLINSLRKNENKPQSITKSLNENLKKDKKAIKTDIIIKSLSINVKCIQGTYFDSQFSQCVRCIQKFRCQSCSEKGCFTENLKNK